MLEKNEEAMYFCSKSHLVTYSYLTCLQIQTDNYSSQNIPITFINSKISSTIEKPVHHPPFQILIKNSAILEKKNERFQLIVLKVIEEVLFVRSREFLKDAQKSLD